MSSLKETASVSAADRRRQLLVLLVLAGGLVLGLVFAIQIIQNAPEVGPPPPGPMTAMPPAAVYVMPLQAEVTRDFAKVTGTLKATARAEVAAREAGAVVEVLVNEGDSVKEGDLLARLDPRRTEALLAEAEASLTAAASLVDQRAAELARAEDDLEMKRGLLERKAVSRSEVLDAEQSLAVGRAHRKSASDGIDVGQSRVDFLRVQLDDLIVRAPFTGVVVARDIEPGEWVDAGTVVVSMVAVDPVEAWLRVPVRVRQSVSESPADLKVRQSATGVLFTPASVSIVPEVEPLSQLFIVVAVIDNLRGTLAPGESITGIVPVGKEEPFWQFHLDALVRAAAGDFVYVVGENETARRVPVEIAFERDGLAYVVQSSSPLKPSDRIVVEGNDRLQPGQGLILREREGAAEAPGS